MKRKQPENRSPVERRKKKQPAVTCNEENDKLLLVKRNDKKQSAIARGEEIGELQDVAQLKDSLFTAKLMATLDWPVPLVHIVTDYLEKKILGATPSQSVDPNFWKYVTGKLFRTPISPSYWHDWNAYLLGPEHIFFFKRLPPFPGFLQCFKLDGEWKSISLDASFLCGKVFDFQYPNSFADTLVKLCKEYSLVCIPWTVYDGHLNSTFERSRRDNEQVDFTMIRLQDLRSLCKIK